MSNDALKLLRRVWIPGPAKAVTWVLADHALDSDWSSYLAQDTIAFESGFKRRTIQRALRKLESEGLISIESRGGTEYGRSSNMTWLVRNALEERARQSPRDQFIAELFRARGRP